MRSLLLVTHNFPNNSGDGNFIKNEFAYLASEFSNINVLCLRGKGKDILDIPENVKITFFDMKLKIFQRVLYLPLVFFYPIFYREIRFLISSKKLSINSIFRLIKFHANALFCMKYIKLIIKEYNPNFVYTYWYTFETMAALLLKDKFNGFKCITRTHRYDLYELPGNHHYQPFKIWMDKNIDTVFFISKDGYDYYIKKFAGVEVNKKKYHIAYLGIYNKYAMQDQRNRRRKFTIISCSYMKPVKRIPLIIESLSRICEINIHWIHIGDIVDVRDGPERQRINSLACKLLENKKNITYEFKGMMVNDSIMDFYNENYFDCFINLSESEGLPVTMMEAISFGIPIIAMDVGGISEIVNNDDIGILLSSKSGIPEIKDALIRFYNLPENKKSMMRFNARLLWESRFNAETCYTKFIDELLLIEQR
jgi:glycosyltransferase involved in cell wall biosynthesis